MTEVNNPTVEGSAAPNRTKRNVILLAICQALAQSGSSLTATVAALAGFLIAQDKSLATLPMAFQFLGTMLSTIPASFFMRRFGRRVGFTVVCVSDSRVRVFRSTRSSQLIFRFWFSGLSFSVSTMLSGNIIGLRQRIRRVKNTAAGRSHTSWRAASLRPLSDRNW